MSVLVAVGVSADGYREVRGVAEGAQEDQASWLEFLKHLKGRGLAGTELFITDKCLGRVEALGGSGFPHRRNSGVLQRNQLSMADPKAPRLRLDLAAKLV